MLSEIRTKIRALIEDLAKSDFQVFAYSNSNIFTLAEPNIVTITRVLYNGDALGSGESYSFDSTTNKITVSGVSFSTNDLIEVDYTFTKYSDDELDEFIRAALSWYNIFNYEDDDYELEEDEIFPDVSKKESDLIALICWILIKPDMSRYRTSANGVDIQFPVNQPKEDRIMALINRFKHGIGSNDVIQWGDFGLDQPLI